MSDCITRVWFDIEKYKITREQVVSADQLLAKMDPRDGVRYCRRGEGGTMSSSSCKSGVTFTLYPACFGDGNVGWISVMIKAKIVNLVVHVITKRLSEYLGNKDKVVKW